MQPSKEQIAAAARHDREYYVPAALQDHKEPR